MRKVGLQIGSSPIEMLLVVAILTATVALCASGMSNLVSEWRLRSVSLAVCDGLRLSRIEAIRRNGHVVMCKSNDGFQCKTTGDWSQGWIVFHDINNSRLVDGGETVLFREAAISGKLLLSGNTPISKDVSYTFSGEAILPKGGFQAGTFTISTRDSSSVPIFCIAVNKRGTYRVYKSYSGICAS
ncbi:GspH/FimT family pseudopilin [Rhodoferax sp. GW822-FHT02A01]|uniref:GspH/FimT family pseudopilin n=1 Tax=Rhodoferax sp. GW822-FHT02A01 TaxID=3141537 RepID=UPI00315D8FC4